MAIKFLNTVQVDTDVLYVDASNDRVGIGTTSPAKKLHVLNSTNEAQIRLGQSGSGSYDIGVYSGDKFSIGRDADTQEFTLSNGNVGIGTTSPGAKLDIINSGLSTMFRLSNTEANATTKYSAIVGRHYTNTEENVTGMLITSSSSATGGTVSIGGGISAANAVNNIILYTAANNTTLTGTERMRITSAGNVGIGTTSPAFPLHVNTSNDVVGYFKSTDNKATIIIADNDTTGYVSAENDRVSIGYGNGVSTSNITILNGSYNVGIGTTSPLTKLHIAGTTDANIIRIENTATALSAGDTIGAIQFFNNDTTDDSPNVAASIYATAGASGGSGSLRFKTIEPGVEGDPATEAMIITNGGTVGIGTTSPQEKVHVSGSSNVRLEVEATDSTVAALKLTNTAGSYGSFVNASGDLSTYDYNAASTRTTLLANGNLGIGTTTPSAKLDVVQATTANGAAALHLIGPNTNAGLTSSVLIIEQSDGKKITMDGNDIDVSSGDLFINDYSGEDVTFGGQIKVKGLGSPVGDSYIANGNFGVGTTSPTTKLDVRGSLRADLITLFSGSTQFLNVSSYGGAPWINTASSGGVINFGAPTSNTTNVYVQGTVEARDGLLGFVPTFVHGGFYHSSSSSSSAIYWIPSNYISETTSTQYYNRFVAPYPGRVKKVIMRWTNGATPTATSVTFRKTQNGGVSSNQYAATVTGGATTSMVATKEFSNTDFTFNAGDKYGIGFMTNGGTRFLYGMTYTLVIEYDI